MGDGRLALDSPLHDDQERRRGPDSCYDEEDAQSVPLM